MPARARMRSRRRAIRPRLVRRTGSRESSSRRERLVTGPPFDTAARTRLGQFPCEPNTAGQGLWPGPHPVPGDPDGYIFEMNMTKRFPSPSAILAVVLGVVSIPGIAASGPADPPSVPAVRADVPTQLPRGVVPTRYEVSVTPHAAALRFDARIAISIEVLEPTAR